MFDKGSYEDRLLYWAMFRDSLEKSQDPLQDVSEKYNKIELKSQEYNPWDEKDWPNPWTLIFENRYCAFLRTLGMCYSLKLTERYKDEDLKFIIAKDEELQTRYLCVVDNHVLGMDNEILLKDDIDNKFSVLKEININDLIKG